MTDETKSAVMEIIQKAYVQGIHEQQDEKTARTGFHDEFRMLVLNGDAVESVDIQTWLARIETAQPTGNDDIPF